MNVGASIIPHTQSPELSKPCQGAFHHPACSTQSAAMHACSLADQRPDAAHEQVDAMPQRAIAGIALHGVGSSARRATLAFDRRNRLHQLQQSSDIRHICGAEDRRQRKPVGVGDEVVFGAGFAAIGGIRAGQFAPPTARRLALSTTARDQSIASAA